MSLIQKLRDEDFSKQGSSFISLKYAYFQIIENSKICWTNILNKDTRLRNIYNY